MENNYTPKIAYKGFDKDLSCRKEKFEIGKVYYKDNVEKPKLCSDQGYHYCNSLKQVFAFYNKNDSRYCEIEILGNISEDNEKSITTAFRIKRELSKDEVEKLKKIGDEKRITETMGLDTVLAIQQKYPLIMVGGSLALFLHGIRLERFGEGNGDIDLIAPFYHEIEPTKDMKVENKNTIISLDEIECDEDAELFYTNDFSERLYINGFKVDIQINPHNRYETIEYQGNKYRVAKLEHIMEAKWRYAIKGSLKHKRDCYEISGKTSK